MKTSLELNRQITLEIISLQGRMPCLMRHEASLFNEDQSAVSRFVIQFLQYRSIEAAAFVFLFVMCDWVSWILSSLAVEQK